MLGPPVRTDPWRTPVVISAGQHTERIDTVGPLDLAERAAAGALDSVPSISGHIDRVEVVGIVVGGGAAPATELARRLRLAPARCATTTIGGNSPQWLAGRAADDIAAGRTGAVLIAGAEAMRSHMSGARVPEAAGAADPVVGDRRAGLSQEELAAGLLVPAHVYPLFESVLAHRAGRTLEEHRAALGRLLAPFTEVAADHPHAWFRERRSAEQIAGPSRENRLTAEPYTKRMNAFLGVDQAAAIVVTSLGRAQALGLADRVVFVWAASDASDVWFPAQRPDLGGSPGIRTAGEAALAAAGVGVDELTYLDLYSCFPSAVQMAAAALGVAEADSRGLTVTGGLPYFGGPGNNYTTHALATMTDRLRDGPAGSVGLVTGLGWYVTKHSVGVYGSSPPPRGYRRGDTSEAQAAIDATALRLASQAEGEQATVDASTVVYDKDGAVSAAPVVARLDDGRRLVARADRPELDTLAGRNLVGCTIRVAGAPPVYRLVAVAGELARPHRR